MSVSMHQVSAPVFVQMLKALDHVLAKAEAHVASGAATEAALFEARLAPDMYPLPRQVQIATDHAKGASFRLAGRDVPKLEDNETTLAALRARIGSVVSMIEELPAAAFDAAELREIVMPMRQGELRFDGARYLLHFALPNFYFHVTTAYDILRSQGVPLGKRDFFGAP